ncbi:OsmC family protein [Sphingomonas sp. HDW15A]|uniref:OsmC family protein n=1 Tax=Sphingomonas sp. HDW15A TaxID=2714942 RepID=UPI00140DA1BF|nr:OsmC family protein [Sphingomonas sp. HDW15A]QIK95929.1 OsmC family protein [Sphingomonas sp. HDW15A]
MTAQLAAERTVNLNGINVTQLMDTIEAIQADPEVAKFEFRTSNKWKDGTQNIATVKSFHGACMENARSENFRYLADEPPVLCGRDEGANPVEYLLSALSMCVTTSIVAHSAARGIRIDAVESELEGDLDVRGFLGMSPAIRKGYQAIRMRMRVRTEASADLLRELADYSPVYDVVSRSVPVELTIETY